MKLNLEDKKFPDWKDLKVNIIEVNAFEDKEIWRQEKWSWSLRVMYEIRFEDWRNYGWRKLKLINLEMKKFGGYWKSKMIEYKAKEI